MWSSPRSASTALSRSFASREDAVIFDEPFYKYRLLSGGKCPNPELREKVVASKWPSNYDEVTQMITTDPMKDGASVIYFKAPVSNVLVEDACSDRVASWITKVKNVFLTRHPADVISSYEKYIHVDSPVDVGYPQQRFLYDEVRRLTGTPPPVFDTEDLLSHPRETLQSLCHVVNIPFLESMLSWKATPRETDFPGSEPWYETVNNSTGFHAAPKQRILSKEQQALVEKILPTYEYLIEHKIRPDV